MFPNRHCQLCAEKCGNLKIAGTHKHIVCGTIRRYKHIMCGTIRRYGFVKVGMALLEEICNCGGGL